MRSIETTSPFARGVRTVFAVLAAIVLSGVYVLTGGDNAHAEFESADFSVSVSDSPDPVNAGSNLTYTITATDNGPDPAGNATISDTLPAGTTFVSLSPVLGWSCSTPATGASGSVLCGNGSFAVGSAVFTLTVNVAEATAAGTVLANTVTVTSSTSDPDGSNNSATATTTVSTSADVSVTTTDSPDPIAAGTDLTYTITATNAGPSASAATSLTDALPAGTTFVSLASPGGWSCSTPASGGTGTVSCTNGSMAVGTAIFTLVVQVGPGVAGGTVISNTATISSFTSDPNTGNESGTATSTVAAEADVAVTLAAPSTSAAGSDLTYTIVAVNSGPGDATSVSLTDTLPIGTTFVSMTQNSGPTWNCSGTATVVCTIAALPAGASSTFDLTVNVGPPTADGTVIINTAGVSAPSPDPNNENDSSTAITTISHINAAPVAVDDPGGIMLEDGGPLAIDVLTNDTDADLDTLTVAAGSWTQGTHGSVTCSTTDCTYTPAPNFHGTDTFTYEATDGSLSDSATVTVEVFSVNDTPVAGSGGAAIEIAVVEDHVLIFNVLDSASDIDGDSLTVISFTQPAHGVVSCASDGECTYTPTAGYVGPDSFTYTISDGSPTGPVFTFVAPASTAVGTVTITVTPAPAATTTTTTPTTSTTTPATTTTPAPATTVAETTTPTTATPTTAPLAAPAPVDLPETGTDVLPVLIAGLTLIAVGIALARRGRHPRLRTD